MLRIGQISLSGLSSSVVIRHIPVIRVVFCFASSQSIFLRTPADPTTSMLSEMI